MHQATGINEGEIVIGTIQRVETISLDPESDNPWWGELCYVDQGGKTRFFLLGVKRNKTDMVANRVTINSIGLGGWIRVEFLGIVWKNRMVKVPKFKLSQWVQSADN